MELRTKGETNSSGAIHKTEETFSTEACALNAPFRILYAKMYGKIFTYPHMSLEKSEADYTCF